MILWCIARLFCSDTIIFRFGAAKDSSGSGIPIAKVSFMLTEEGTWRMSWGRRDL
jgi:hypothetical protein